MELQLSLSPSKEYSGMISFGFDRLDLLAVQGTLKSLLQPHSSKASILWHSAFFTVQLSHPYMTTGIFIPMNIQDQFTLGWTGWISLHSDRLSRVSPTPQFKSINFSVLSLFYCPALTSIHDYRKNHSVDYIDLCQQKQRLCFLIHCIGLSLLFFQGASVF